jgi:hypothetical protein
MTMGFWHICRSGSIVFSIVLTANIRVIIFSPHISTLHHDNTHQKDMVYTRPIWCKILLEPLDNFDITTCLMIILILCWLIIFMEAISIIKRTDVSCSMVKQLRTHATMIVCQYPWYVWLYQTILVHNRFQPDIYDYETLFAGYFA